MIHMDGVLTVLDPLLILIILDGLFKRLDHSEIQFLTAVTAGFTGDSRHLSESPEQLVRRDVWLSPLFTF